MPLQFLTIAKTELFFLLVTSSRSSLALSDGFDDTKTWDDHDALDVSDVNHDVIQALNTSTPDEKSERRNAHAQNRMLVTSSSTPPTSSLVTKLFPRLKTKNEVLGGSC